MQQYINTVNNIIFEVTGDRVIEYWSTVEDVVEKRAGMHRGLYYIYPEKNFYFGLAKSKDACIATKRMDTHILKLTVDLARLYGGKYKNTVEKKEPYKQFPAGWKEGVCKYIIEGVDEIPNHYEKTATGVKPGVVDFPVKFKVDPLKLPVVLWNLDAYTPAQIDAIEDKVIDAIEPYCNTETYKKRKKAQKSY